MKDPRDQIWVEDEDGARWLIGADGKRVRDGTGNLVPGPARKTRTSGFTVYATTQGHCGLCGSLSCRGACFR